MQVQAVPGLKVPMEDKPHDYITDASAVDVPDTAYYQRRISDGDLVLVFPPSKPVKGAA
jgi:hypothetical protein